MSFWNVSDLGIVEEKVDIKQDIQHLKLETDK